MEKKSGQTILNNPHTLELLGSDFGRLVCSKPAAVCEPKTVDTLQSLMNYAHDNQLPITIRGLGLSQSGQSVAPPGGLILDMKHFNHVQEPKDHSIWVGANSTWADLLEYSLPHSLVPYVIPYNCHLSIGGVLSAGGIGASSFNYGSIISHALELEVVQANGELNRVATNSPLMQACLGGQGQFGVITQARIALTPTPPWVRTFFLTYVDKEAWLGDMQRCQPYTDYIESFCAPAIQGAKLSATGRQPFAQWLYALHIAIAYENQPPEVHDLPINPWKIQHVQDESIHSYLHRHDTRFQMMKITGQWELPHPWYECFIPEPALDNLEELLDALPLHYASTVHLIPVNNAKPTGFLILPHNQNIFSLMILNPGLPTTLTPSCLDAIKNLDAVLLPQGGKRYLSGFLGAEQHPGYWKAHFGERYDEWLELKKNYDPCHIFCSFLHQ